MSDHDVNFEQDEGPGDIHLIDGTSSLKSYLVFAKKGPVLLGVKFYGLLPGETMNAPNKTYLFARIRSAKDPQVASQIDNVQSLHNVVKLQNQSYSLPDAWPEIEFEKVDDSRASVPFGVFLRGSLAETPEIVVDRLSVIDVYQNLAEFIVEKAGADYCILTPRQIAKWLMHSAKPMIGKMKHNIHLSKAQQNALGEFAEQQGEDVEIAGFHTQQLKSMLEKSMKNMATQGVDANNLSSIDPDLQGEGEDPDDPDNNDD